MTNRMDCYSNSYCPNGTSHTTTQRFDIQRMAIEWAKDVLRKDLPVQQNCYIRRYRTPYTLAQLGLQCVWDDVQIQTKNFEVTSFDTSKLPERIPLSKSNFTNNTDMEQTYTFCTNKSTKCRALFAIHAGMCMGERTNVNFPIPTEILNETVEFGKDVTIDHVDHTKLEQQMHWSSEHPIRVPAGSSTVTETYVLERSLNINFTAQTVVSGRVKILVRDSKDNRLVKELQNSIAAIVKDWQLLSLTTHPMAWFPDGCRWDLTKASATFDVRGASYFQYGFEQCVKVNHD